MSSTVRWFVTWAACLSAGLIQSSPVWATRPGFNGALAYVQDNAIYVDGRKVSQPPENAIDSSPAWSLDGRQIAFIRSSFRIYVMNADGSNLRPLVTAAQPDEEGFLPRGYFSSVGWSANGLDVTFLTSENPSGPYLRWRVMADLPHVVTGGGTTHRAGEPQRDVLEREKEVYACERDAPEICILDGGSVALNLTGELQEAVGANIQPQVSTPQWQPTSIAGRPRILFAAKVYPDGSPPARREVYSINPQYHYNPATGGGTYEFDTRRVTVSAVINCGNGDSPTPMPETEYYTPVPSPDGKYFVAEKWTRSGSDCAITKQLYRFSKDGTELGQVGSEATQPAWQPKQAQLAVNVTTILDDPLDGAEVTVRSDDAAGTPVANLTTDTARGGVYLFSGLQPGDYRIRVTLKNPAFEIHHDYDYPSAEPVWVEKKITVEDNQQGLNFPFVFDDTDASKSSLGSDSRVDRLSDMSLIFRNLHQFVEWVTTNLTPTTGARVPFYTFATTRVSGDPVGANEAFYNRDAGAVWMGTAESSFAKRAGSAAYASPWENSEWHEFTHHLFDSSCVGQANHGGYRNASTCDSLSEGFASFLAGWANASQDSFYAGFGDLEWHQKAWGARFSGGTPPLLSDEDMAVAALLWDIVDTAVDYEYTNLISNVITGVDAHLPATYADTVSVPLQTLWGILQNSGARTVYDLRGALNVLPEFSNLTVDLDNDGIKDVSVGDQLFLMHGFFPIQNDQAVSGNHRSYHYNVNGGGAVRNGSIGLSSHSSYNFNGYSSETIIPRSNVPVAPNANLRVDMRDASGTPLKDTELELSIFYPGSTQTLRKRLGDGAGALVPFGLPTYFDNIPDGSALPSCNLDYDLYVSVMARATVNGFAAANAPTFDNCDYLQALFAATGDSALSIAFQFPEDSVAPQATRVVSQFGGQLVNGRPNVLLDGVWVVELTCNDPVVGGFATGCLPVEYRLDNGSWRKYEDEFDVREPGLHTLEVRAEDRAGNAASVDAAIELGIVTVFDPDPPVTTLTAVPSLPPLSGYTAGIWRVTLACEDRNNASTTSTPAPPSGCVTTEYRVDGAPFTVYRGAFELTAPGDHTVEYRSTDLMNNVEATRSNLLRIAGTDTTPPITFVEIAFGGGAYVFDDAAMSSSITFSIDRCSDSFAPPDQKISGCATSEYAVDAGDFAPYDAPVVVTQPGLHTIRWRSIDVAGNLEDTKTLTVTLVVPVDQDGDAVFDWYDNCVQAANPDQRNSDYDLFGDRCDPDFNANGRVDSQDASLLKSRLGSTAYRFLDLSGNGVVDSQDEAILKAMFGKPPGPAGVAVYAPYND